MAGTHILVCDDEPAIRKTLGEVLEDEDYAVASVDSGEALLSYLSKAEQRIDLVLLDVWLPGMDGVDALTRMREQGHTMPVVMISGHANLELAVRATKHGAFDLLEKPLNLDKVVLTINNALRQRHLEKRNVHLEAQLPQAHITGSSAAIQRLREDIEMAAPTPGRVLILGESGSGKELAARRIHELSNRASGPFVEMNCAAIPESLIETELFGHVKGSFTDADANRVGKFEQADGGTLFLDEIADMSLASQAKVLRVLQEQCFQMVGSNKTVHVDVRVIAATNKDLQAEIAAGHFRQDLFFRLHVIPLRVPPLRERIEDVPELCTYFVEHFAKSYGRPPIRFTERALDRLRAYTWPGNVRELRNLVERLMIMSRERDIHEKALPAFLNPEVENPAVLQQFGSLKEARDDFERRYIEFTLKQHGGNITRSAENLNLERSNLHKKLKQYGIDASQFAT